jgi:hypothetical protein
MAITAAISTGPQPCLQAIHGHARLGVVTVTGLALRPFLRPCVFEQLSREKGLAKNVVNRAR